MATHVRYLVSKQGNRNLVMDRDDNQTFTDLTDADTRAHGLAAQTGQPYYVHEVTVRHVLTHGPNMVVKSSDMPA